MLVHLSTCFNLINSKKNFRSEADPCQDRFNQTLNIYNDDDDKIEDERLDELVVQLQVWSDPNNHLFDTTDAKHLAAIQTSPNDVENVLNDVPKETSKPDVVEEHPTNANKRSRYLSKMDKMRVANEPSEHFLNRFEPQKLSKFRPDSTKVEIPEAARHNR